MMEKYQWSNGKYHICRLFSHLVPIYRGFTLTCFIAGPISLDFGLAFSVAKKSVGPVGRVGPMAGE